MKRWIAVSTHAKSEDLALQHLSRQGYIGYCPKVPSNSKGTMAGKMRIPLFPGYVFVCIDDEKDQWRPVQYTRGVRAVLKFGERLGFLPEGFIEGLISREEDGLIMVPGMVDRFEVGDHVTINNRAFDGVIGTIISVGARDRIWVLLDLLKGNVRMAISPAQLQKVS